MSVCVYSIYTSNLSHEPINQENLKHCVCVSHYLRAFWSWYFEDVCIRAYEFINKCSSRNNDSPQFSSSAWFPQSSIPLQCMSWGRQKVRFPQGKYPSGQVLLSSVILSAVNKAEKQYDWIESFWYSILFLSNVSVKCNIYQPHLDIFVSSWTSRLLFFLQSISSCCTSLSNLK